MKRAEQFFIGLFITAVLFRVMHWPMSGMLMILSTSLLSILYFPLAALWFGDPERRDQVLWLSVAGGFALSMQLMGILFAFQRWPLALSFLRIGTVLCITIVVLGLLVRSKKPALAAYFRALLIRAGSIGVLGALLLYLHSGATPVQIGHDIRPEVAQGPSTVLRPEWAQQIADSNAVGVFVLWEPDSQRLQTSDSVRMKKGFLPASTFKVFNSLVALQEGAVADETTIIPWDGVTRRSPDWNEDQNMSQAIARSTVWWYQEVARRAGAGRMQHWLDAVAFGNHTMGDSIHLFWLQGALRITPLEQIRFMQTLHEERLPFDLRHQRTVKRILPGDSTATWKRQGKSGWAIRVEDEYGWYVGWAEHNGRTAYFALNIDIHSMEDVRKRYTLTDAILAREGWMEPQPADQVR
ncbi:MAG TPA: penicillin-binding transpeptidase domain-containing protein [Flavobacteriales bacterium]|nr:penicillin-binding transpeptidase domain-containing protein [Flavobacteriales bacterium]